ncbi:MAG: hypothetical protein K0R66_996 [Gammaproteobacteria bacterium]|jgi:dTDP-4-dehydrorhamnose reductase|nr:hypothetical protein [Gammaproteobacteria bacterium]
MKILLLGANGQVGTDFFKASKSSGFQVKSLTRENIDISHLEKLAKLLAEQDFDVLLNCTAFTQVDKAETEIEASYLINAYAVGKMAQACQLKKAKFIHISTDYVFGNNQSKKALDEQIPPGPLNIYGQSKLLGEQLAQAHCENTVILRSASLYGIKQSNAKGNFVETILRLAKDKGSLRVIANQIMSPTSSAELAKMIIKIIESEASPGIYHAVNSGQASWYEFACAIIEKSGISCEITPISAGEYPLPAKRPDYSVLDNCKLSKIIGPIANWQQALEQYLKARQN